METYVHIAIEFQRNKLKELYSNKKNSKETLIEPEFIDIEMDKLKKILLNLIDKNHKTHYQSLSDAAKKKDYLEGLIDGTTIKRSYSSVKFIQTSEVFATIEYTLLYKWKIVVGLWETKWNELSNEYIVNMVKKFVPYFTVSILEQPKGKKNVVLSKKENCEYYTCGDLLIPLGKLIRALADANIVFGNNDLASNRL